MDEDRFVSRGGLKLQAALDAFKIPLAGKVVLDVGSSTGGFVDCLLQNAAFKVYSVDTAYGELAWKLRNDQRVVVLERTNILYLNEIPEPVDLVTIDASWTKLELILPVVKKFIKPNTPIVALLKPHYQTQTRNLHKGVVPAQLLEEIKNQTIENLQNQGVKVEKIIPSPILGGGGNHEFLLLLSFE